MTLADENEYARVCLYGKYGTGKTTDLAFAAKLGKVVHIDSEKRLKGGPLRRLGVPIDNIEPIRDISYDIINDVIWDTKSRLHDEPGSVAALGMDSVTETTKLLVGQVLDENSTKLIARAEKRGEEADVDPYNIDIDMWGVMTEQMRRILRHMRDLECHLVFTAHERRDIDGDGEVIYGPATTPAVQQDLMGYVDIVGHTYIDNGHYVARFAPGTKYQAKDTFGVLPEVMADPTMDRIVAYVREKITAETDPIQQRYLAERQKAIERTKEKVGEPDTTRRRRRSNPAT